MFAKVKSCGLIGVEGYIVDVEIFVSPGLFHFDIVGLPDISVKEAKERVHSAIKINNYEFSSQKVIINLSPATLKKEGSAYDLSIAIGFLLATNQIKRKNLDEYLILGELRLDGTINKIRGVLPMIICAEKKGIKKAIVPAQNINEASVVNGIDVYPVHNLKEVVDYFNDEIKIEPISRDVNKILEEGITNYDVDFKEVKGQQNVKRALEVAAAGGHNVIMAGSAGCGKTMLSKRMPTILPDITLEEAMEVTKIHSIVGNLKEDTYLKTTRPFRAPHHTISQIALVGGGTNPKPGELSMAHYGVLFFDELSEFPKKILESLRQPLEDKQITISRINYNITYPCKVMLVAAMNLCPCGNKGNPAKECLCSEHQMAKYRERISGALMDRFDLQIEVAPIKQEDLINKEDGEESIKIKQRVNKARKIQNERYKNTQIFSNSEMKDKDIKKYCKLDKQCNEILTKSFKILGLSTRGYTKILKVSRTIADLDNSEDIKKEHILEAIQYRTLDRGIK